MAGLRVGIIGCGSIGRAHAHGWTTCERTDLVAIADITPAARDEFGDHFAVPAAGRYADFREMLDSERLDIVSVCLWHGQHASTVVAAAARQPKVILCEKPMATSLGEAEQMLIAAQRNSVKLAIGHQRRFLPGWNEARRLVADGAIGRPTHLWSTVADGLLNWGTHTIDMMRYIMDDPEATSVVGAVQRESDRYERGMRIEDSCLGLIQFANGAQATIQSDLTPRELASINCNFYGTEGVLTVDENTVRLMNGATSGWRDLSLGSPDHTFRDAFAAQADGIVDWIEGRVDNYRGEATKAYKVVEIMMALYESARLNEVTRLPLLTRANPLDLMVESGALPVSRPGKYDIRSFLVRGEGMSWLSQ
ncbi:MAG: Gfo/Idh/MocA family oxidoreductase [Chloroflexi bacterium]|nr:Gfo/Idh/MocA family oxidoreductase [Chloroflexota bacterium]